MACHHCVCTYHYRNENGVACIMVIWGRNGTRMGCVLGSIGFDITVHHFVYSKLSVAHPKVDYKSLTDDLPTAVPAPREGASQDEWEAHYDYIAQLFLDYDKLANPIGMIRHKGKCKVLLPPWAPAPGSLIRKNGLTLHLVWDGITLSGTPIGTPQFIWSHTRDKLTVLTRKIRAMVDLSKHETHISYHMIAHCPNHAWRYYVRVTPPSLIQDLIHQYDNMIMENIFTCIRSQGMKIGITSQARRERVEVMFRIPSNLRGG